MSDLDELMARDPLSLTSTDIDSIIAYHRRERARKASGEKSPSAKATAVDLDKLMGIVATPTEPKADLRKLLRR